MKTKMNRLSIELFPEQHKKIKVLASLEGCTIKEYVINRLLGQNKTSNKQFNALTLKALKDIEEENNLTEYKTSKDLFRKTKNAKHKNNKTI